MAKIGLIDVDSHNFPNLPLMKIAAYHREQGNSVEFVVPLCEYDRVYVSKIFDFTPDYNAPILADEISYGGTGYGLSLSNRLSESIEYIYPAYDIYPQFDAAYGFLSRGCPRGCPYCIVSSKEGIRSHQVADLDSFWRGQKEIKLLDPNLLACKDREKLLEQLIASNAWIDFTQGLDIRSMTKDIADLLMRCKIKRIHFAWDSERFSELILKKLEEFKNHTNIPYQKATVYVLVNYDTDFSFDLERVYTLKNLGYNPYIMIYDKQNAPQNVRHLQRWVNNRIIFRSCERFEDYNPKLA